MPRHKTSKHQVNRNGNRGNSIWLYGKHSVLAALDNPRRQINRILVTRNVHNDFKHLLPKTTEMVEDKKISHEIGNKDAVHQGIAIEVEPLNYTEISEIPDIDESRLVVLLDQVTDPHNVGAVLRSASAFGASAVITTERNSPAETGVLAKSASGALEYVPYVRVINLSVVINELKELGFTVIGLDGEAKESITQLAGHQKLAIVMGAEGSGMRHKTREFCDLLVKIPINEAQESLNISNAAAIALWEAKRGQ